MDLVSGSSKRLHKKQRIFPSHSYSNLLLNNKHSVCQFSNQYDSSKCQYSLSKSQLINHQERKQLQKKHSKTQNEFYKNRKEIVKMDNLRLAKKKIQAQNQNQLKDCSKFLCTHGVENPFGRNFGKKDIYPAFQMSRYVLNKKHSFTFKDEKNSKQKILKAESEELRGGKGLKKVKSNHRIYLSNILNLNELKQQLSYSRAKFHRKAIKMQRDIGKQYIRFSENLGGSKSCFQGIFL